MNERYDAIVLGVGGVGSAAVAHLAARGADVLGLERYDVPHGYGSSHGFTRHVQPGYHADPAYDPLVRRAYELWRDLEDECDRQLLYETGAVHAGPPDSDLLADAKRACERLDADHEILSSDAVADRYAGFDLPEAYEAVFQPEGGFLVPEACTVAHVERAHREGATIRARERVVDWRSLEDGVRVETDHASYEAGRLVVAAGAWTPRLVDELANVLVPERQVLAWFQPDDPVRFAPDRFPVWNLQVPEGRYYGSPVFRVPGVSVGRFHHREETVDPDAFERDPTAADERLLRSFAETHLPEIAGPTMRMETCLFTNTPDERFVLDTLADESRVVVGAGFSGHGFAIASAVGEALADLALEGETEYDTGAFSLDRFREDE